MSKSNAALYRSPSTLSEETRRKVGDTLNQRLADGLDLHSQIKVAHWNIKGPQFPGLHPLFETFAIDLGNFNDAIAERAVTLGGRAYGTVRHVASQSRLPEYPQETTRDVDHVRLLADRFDTYLEGARQSRSIAGELADTDTADLLTQAITAFEKHAWFLRASSEG
jgi:starvation-inducible DNA-binding protein